MGHHYESKADLVVQALQLHLHGFTELGVERRQRLVEQQDLRPPDQGTGERHALLLADGKLRRPAVGLVEQLDRVERLLHLARRLAPLHAGDGEAVADVLRDREVREERKVLKHHVDGSPIRRKVGHVAPVERDAARIGKLEPAHHAERRGLAAAGGPEDGEKLAFLDGERHIVHGAHTAAERLADVLDFKMAAIARRFVSWAGGAYARSPAV